MFKTVVKLRGLAAKKNQWRRIYEAGLRIRDEFNRIRVEFNRIRVEFNRIRVEFNRIQPSGSKRIRERQEKPDLDKT